MDDVRTRDEVFGKPMAIAMGKMNRMRPSQHDWSNSIPVFEMISEKYKNAHIFMGLFYVNGNKFFHRKSENLNY